MSTKQKKYFVAVSYGVGTARWNSTIKNTQLYDKTGTIIRDGVVKFKAKNSTAVINLEALAPVGKVRLGLGISFEEFYLNKLNITTQSSPVDKNILRFDESFRFNKIYAQVEVPFKYQNQSNGSINFNGHLGYYGYSGIDRINFFGEEAIAKTFFATAGLVFDYRVYPHFYFFAYPNIEYKYFDNSHMERPSDIIHNIFTGTLMGGIRVDLSKE